MPKKTSERTCWNCQHSGVCFLKRRMGDLLRDGIAMLTIDGHSAFGLWYQEFHVTLGRSCTFYTNILENPDA